MKAKAVLLLGMVFLILYLGGKPAWAAPGDPDPGGEPETAPPVVAPMEPGTGQTDSDPFRPGQNGVGQPGAVPTPTPTPAAATPNATAPVVTTPADAASADGGQAAPAQGNGNNQQQPVNQTTQTAQETAAPHKTSVADRLNSDIYILGLAGLGSLALGMRLLRQK